ncbi:Juxtaposed with another zinc finger protein 1 [Halocaridina rubra]|uniref:Juxtaposed with another zinc finger protein 1 n=1 Tax=Halocaridina rubra TaxID=373956 RepID=A0AAN9AC43_HALRR
MPFQQLIMGMMAVFLLNPCKFQGCDLSFPTLLELIQHIEDIHIDPVTEAAQERQKPHYLPLSSVLRFFGPSISRTLPRKHPLNGRPSGGPPAKVAKLSNPKTVSPPPIVTTSSNGGNTLHLSSLLVSSAKSVGTSSVGGSSVGTPSSTRESTPVSAISNSPPASDCEENLLSENEDSNDSWTTQDEIPAEFIIKAASKGHTAGHGDEKPFVCPVIGCKKRYKNVNGIKYHARNAHKKDSKVRKPYRCYCGKSYITNQGLKNHCSHSHKNESMTMVTTNTGEILHVPSTQISSSDTTTLHVDNGIDPTSVLQKSRMCLGEGILQVSGTSLSSAGTGQVAVTGQFIKGGSNVPKGSTSISSVNLSGLVAAGGGKIAFKALSNGQLLLSQPLDSKLTSLVKAESRLDGSGDENKGHILQLKTDGYQQLELKKLALPLTAKSNHHQLAVTTSTISLAVPANSFSALKNPKKTVASPAFIARALKTQLATNPLNIATSLEPIDNSTDDTRLSGQGVILGVTMEEGTLIEDGDGTLSELSVID